MTYSQLLDAVTKFWTDKSRPIEETVNDLNTIISEIQIIIEALESENRFE